MTALDDEPTGHVQRRLVDDWVTSFETRNGNSLQLRPADGADKPALFDSFARLSSQSRHQRFFSAMPVLPNVVADRLAMIDQWSHLAWAAFDPRHREGRQAGDAGHLLGVGVVHVFRHTDAPVVGEIATTVIDAYQRQGIGTILLGVGGAAARAAGIETLTAAVLATNNGMLDLLRSLGGRTRRNHVDRTVVDVDLDAGELAARLPGDLARHVHHVAHGLALHAAPT
jgi:GNAT superfamily N-acetyltransferase